MGIIMGIEQAIIQTRELDAIFQEHYIGKRVMTPYGSGIAISWRQPGIFTPVRLVVDTDIGSRIKVNSKHVYPL
jgi:hypothetical protein